MTTRPRRKWQEGARNVGGPGLPSILVKRRFLDGIIWLAVGVSLVAQGGFIFFLDAWPTEVVRPPRDAATSLVATSMVGVAFLLAGVGALYLGVRRLRPERWAPARATTAPATSHRAPDTREAPARTT